MESTAFSNLNRAHEIIAESRLLPLGFRSEVCALLTSAIRAAEADAATIDGLRRQLAGLAHSHGLLRKSHEPAEIKAPAEGFGNLIDAFDRIEWHGDAGTMRAIFEETTARGGASITRRIVVETMDAPPKPEPETKP